MSERLPPPVRAELAAATRLERLTLWWMASVVGVMAVAMGSSQAMRTAWIEDILSLVPAIVFLVARRIERRPPTRRFPFGFDRVNSLAFLISAVALAAVGAVLALESALSLVRAEHPTIAPVTLFGATFWQGWLMIAALGYSVVPPVLLGRAKLPCARRLQDKVLHTDAMMQRADWQTGLAGIVGVLGVGLGFWWADAAAAILISASILHDGVRALRISAAELIDGAPRDLEADEIDGEVAALIARLDAAYPGATVRVRETGRFIHAEISGAAARGAVDLPALWPGPPERAWRLAQLSFVAAERPPGGPATG